MAKTTRERQLEARQTKLDHVQEQIDSGELVIRTMTPAERVDWVERRRKLDASSTPAERGRRAAALENRRRRMERNRSRRNPSDDGSPRDLDKDARTCKE